MEELVKSIAAQANISEEQARLAADLTINFVKARLGNVLEVKVHTAITGEPEESVKEKMEDIATEAKEKFGQVAGKVSDEASEAFDKLKGKLGTFFHKDEKKDEPK
jgi:uncharacterized protein YjbJ (UPF0337 family)